MLYPISHGVKQALEVIIMPRETEPDRESRKQQARHDRLEKARRKAAQHGEQLKARSDAQEMLALIPRILQLLREKGSSGMYDIEVRERQPRLGGLLGHTTTTDAKAARLLGTYIYRMRRPHVNEDAKATVFLLADGRLGIDPSGGMGPLNLWDLTADSPMTLPENEFLRKRVLASLKEMLQELEVGTP
jgi:hypothetical protein